jgi:hypothetical protein
MPTEHNPETGSTSLKRMILGQAMEATAIPMVLFSSDTLADGDGDGPVGQPDAVARAAYDLDIDLDSLRLFSYDAYRLQSALGEAMAP